MNSNSRDEIERVIDHIARSLVPAVSAHERDAYFRREPRARLVIAMRHLAERDLDALCLGAGWTALNSATPEAANE